MSESDNWDICVVGAGAAGLMTAIQSAQLGRKVILLDAKQKYGAKILISGGTRCNVTNQVVTPDDFHSEFPRTVRNILAAFPKVKTLAFFQDIGVKLVLEPDGKYFPTTHSGRTVLDALMNRAGELGVTTETPRKVTQIVRDERGFNLSGEGFSYRATTVVLTTGGLSFPATGSDGSGYDLASSLGHKLVVTSPSLTPLTNNDKDLQSLSGVALPAKLTFWKDGKAEAVCEGAMLFTHFGYSGPVILDISRHWIRNHKSENIKITANFLARKKPEQIEDAMIAESRARYPRSVANFLCGGFPERFVAVLLKRLKISERTSLAVLKKGERENILNALFSLELPITGHLGYEKAEVTAGGISLEDVDAKTLESKRTPGLYFAGEILDVDGRIGGFNFQWAWASGTVVAQSVSKKYFSK